MYWLPVIFVFPYLFLLLKIYRSLQKIEPFITCSDPTTFVSVVIACSNEEKTLPILLNSIENQSYPHNLFEVIVVNDNSTDRTYEIADGYTGTINIKPIHNKGNGKKTALRTGIDHASGNLIVTTDADCLMNEGWLRTVTAGFEKYRPDMLICPVKIQSGQGLFKKFQEIEFFSLQGITAGTAYSGKATMCNGANLSFTRKSYLNHCDNLHDEIASGDDVFFLHSLKKEKGSVILWLESKEATVTTGPCASLIAYLKQRSRWISKGKAYNDCYTISLAIVTFVTIILQISLFIAALINPVFWYGFLIFSLIKSVPDFLITRNRSLKQGKRQLMSWFPAAQLIYPLYVIGVSFYTLIIRK